jgi:hypothetical protein
MSMKVLDKDVHCGWTGNADRNNVYRITISNGRGPFTLRCYYWTPKDSYGKILIRKLPNGQAQEVAWWEELSTNNRVWPTNRQGGNQGLNDTITSLIAGAQIEGVDYDVTRLLSGPGTYEIEFKYQTPNRAGKPVPNGTYIQGVEISCSDPNTFSFAGQVESKSPVKWAWFVVGCGLLVSALAFAAWGFSLKQLAEDQRRILLWVLPLASGVAAGAFAGSMSVRAQGFLPGLVITATGGFGVWLLSFFFLFPKHPDVLSISQNGPESITKEVDTLSYTKSLRQLLFNAATGFAGIKGRAEKADQWQSIFYLDGVRSTMPQIHTSISNAVYDCYLVEKGDLGQVMEVFNTLSKSTTNLLESQGWSFKQDDALAPGGMQNLTLNGLSKDKTMTLSFILLESGEGREKTDLLFSLAKSFRSPSNN